ncbi:UDP-N-acetylglucosamine--N-acetylmuramyl-(pentapeptide) pyrophosphoryl-undecaprenol N-acetylglucosamine transferase [Mycetocola manganoxydans]|uniref:UDP-N-acetylglucosamine--N-acetylmuramyl-(pentapeptide) pyrophosphoryl-undecaprenol N-acetylglucosamine transferase n=1 Tax=Mycetocola manganoxydans TaxID=699879 RepID=A0A3L6ZXH2_9MICO|nr:UDP-N-acetylglucosamine--N-acetylmuramyl-(pentapeptide) pyrophosphoryl-undecaprenol N-acetylglucosamine transferase [Mycetocola manganoxydans]RLP72405.1 UDP-N-acetylglucosamine--N-acetylmuramyl-(pentapeptide) pyrophosphoryl-undecaprenol N-acetylglucosamine transferase [Mycetocola manganoxydans]GHD40510.1 UDP-N-acetylglucosamine--N-acetylmuramyl-(pentapeptide) pyrophosphoryl-undecaprenol N-acetylglucosamine transferase [Mycetocola manganoxydans]
MTAYLLAGGGTAGHVNPLLAVADAITEREPDAQVLVLGTKEGLESRLVPERGYELLTIAKLPFPRRINRRALSFGSRFRQAVSEIVAMIAEHNIDVVVGFGGYASAPAYLAARRAGIPVVVHEANAKPGLANRLGARFTPFVGVAFHGTKLRQSRFVGMPLRREIERLDRDVARKEAADLFGLAGDRPTLLVTGGSLGARRVNETIFASRQTIIDAGYQILHIVGSKSDLTDPGTEHYHLVNYCDRMDLALAVADFAVSRAGAATVSELSALGIPAAYVPYPVGNGEQRYNAADAVHAGGAVIVLDAKFTPEWIETSLVPLITDRMRVQDMAVQSRLMGTLEGTSRMYDLIHESLAGR